MDLIGARIVQAPEALAHGTDNHTAPIYKRIPVSVNAYGDFVLSYFVNTTILGNVCVTRCSLPQEGHLIFTPFKSSITARTCPQH